MKKLLFLLTMLLTTLGAIAQDWNLVEPDGKEYSSTWVIAQLNTNLTATSTIAIGAFIGDECRAIAYPEGGVDGSNTQGGSLIYSIRIPSYKRFGEPDADIKFRAYDASTGLEYPLAETVKYINEGTYGTPTQPMALNLTAPTKYTITLVEVAVGTEYNLADYLKVEPTTCIKPSNLQWKVLQTDAGVTIENGVLKATKPYSGLTLQVSGTQGKALASKTIDVVLHAQTITLRQTEISVEKTDFGVQKLNDFAFGTTTNLPYIVGPEGNTDYMNVKWEVQKQDDPVVALNEEGKFTILKKGEAKIRPYVVCTDKNTGKQTLIYPLDADGNEIWVTVKVSVPVTSIEVDKKKYGDPVIVNLNDQNIYEKLKDIVAVMPEDASNRNFKFQCTDGSMKVEGNKITALRAGEGFILVVSEGKTAETSYNATQGTDATNVPQQVTQRINVLIENPAIDVKFLPEGSTSLSIPIVDNAQVDVNAKLQEFIGYVGETKQNISIDITPIDGSSVTGEGHLDSNSGNVAYNFNVNGEGETTLQIVLKWKDYEAWKGNPNAIPTGTKTVTFIVYVRRSFTLNRFVASYTEAITDQEVTLTLTPDPKEATFNADDVELYFQLKLPEEYATIQGLPDLFQIWSPQVITSKRVQKEDGSLAWTFTSSVPGDVAVKAILKGGQSEASATGATNVPIYRDSENLLDVINVGYALKLAEGWQWRSNPWGNVKPDAFATVYGGEKTEGKMSEIRTQSSLLYNDNEYGFYGSLMNTRGLGVYEAYKVKMKEAYDGVIYGSISEILKNPPSNMRVNGTTVTLTLSKGWNWVGFPYFFTRSLNTVFANTGTQLPEGLTIMGKESFNEYPWSADGMMYLQGGQGYLVYNPSDALTLSVPFEMTLAPGNEGQADDTHSVRAQVWGFDHSRFMNNMAVIAKLEDMDNPDDYVVGAFVNGECRGEGNVRDGKVYLTVHCEGGEQVNFKLYNKLTGETEDICEDLRAQTLVGSSRAPFRLHSVATGIQRVDQTMNGTQHFDLSGRLTDGQQRGIVILRTADGKYRKVVTK